MGKVAFILLLLPVGCFCIAPPLVKENPCEEFKELDDILSRSPDVPGNPLIIDDSKLARDWYAAPAGWELLSHAPGAWETCGTSYPIYRQSKGKKTSSMCTMDAQNRCVRTLSIDQEMCGTREVYRLYTPLKNSGFCFSCVGRKLDILIITDVSRSIGPSTFEKMKQFQESLLKSIDISPDTDAVALLEFAESSKILITLDSPSSVKKADVLSKINQQDYENGPSTDIANALEVAVSDVFTAQTGDRKDAENMVILFTDGWLDKSEKEDVDAVIGRLSAKADVLVVASKGENPTIRVIASEPKEDHIFHLHEVEKIKKKIMPCPPVNPKLSPRAAPVAPVGPME